MKALLVIPPYRTTDALVTQLYPIPLGPVMIGTVLKQAGHEVAIKDFLLPAEKSKCPRPAAFKGQGAPQYAHYGLPLADCKKWLSDNAGFYDVIGLAMGQCNIFETGQELARHIKDLGKQLIIGGPFVTTATDEAMDRTGADVAVAGEGEGVCVEAFDRAAAGESGLILDGSPANLAELPIPDWSLAPPKGYPKYNGRTRGVLAISRGCPHGCEFCSVHTIMGRKYRRQDPERIKAELVALWGQGVRYFCFLDDNLFITEKSVIELERVIGELRAEIGGFARARFYVEEGLEVRVAAIPGLIGRVAALGFENIALGLETMNAATRQAVRKPYDPAQLEAAIANCESAGITAKAFYIVGFPGDTTDSVCRDLVQFGELGLAARPNNLKLYPGTETTAQYRRNGWIDDGYDWRLSSWYTPPSGGMTFPEVKKCKTILGAIGKAAELFGVALFRDPWDEIAEAMAKRRYYLERGEEGAVVIRGNMYRATPFLHLAEMLLLREGASGAELEIDKPNKRVIARPLAEPANKVQAGIVRALRPVTVIERLFTGQDWQAPSWIVGDSRDTDTLLTEDEQFDLLFTCPPYYDKEVYSADPADLSNAPTYGDFLAAYREIIAKSVARLRDNRFAVYVVGDLRDRQGFIRPFVADTIRAFEDAGMFLYNAAILVTAHGSLPIRITAQFQRGRKLGGTHQYVLIFFKGDPETVKEWGEVDVGEGLEWVATEALDSPD